MNETVFICPCESAKTHKLLMDGGLFGIYKLELCHGCYLKQDKKFLISEDAE